MLTVPQAKVLLKNHKNDLVPVILGCQTHFKITIDGQFIAAQRSGQTPQARQFKTLSAAYSYLRTLSLPMRTITLRKEVVHPAAACHRHPTSAEE